MLRKRIIVAIWFVFEIWEFVVNYGDFIRLTCILYVGLVGNFQLKYKFGFASYTR